MSHKCDSVMCHTSVKASGVTKVWKHVSLNITLLSLSINQPNQGFLHNSSVTVSCSYYWGDFGLESLKNGLQRKYYSDSNLIRSDGKSTTNYKETYKSVCGVITILETSPTTQQIVTFVLKIHSNRFSKVWRKCFESRNLLYLWSFSFRNNAFHD